MGGRREEGTVEKTDMRALALSNRSNAKIARGGVFLCCLYRTWLPLILRVSFKMELSLLRRLCGVINAATGIQEDLGLSVWEV